MSKVPILREWISLDVAPETIKESIEQNSGKIVLHHKVLQKADTLNQNGRIYPRQILEREVRNYQKFIRENRATGELDHPDCVPAGTEILTQNGWKKIESISSDETVATLNIETQAVEYQQITEKVDQQYIGKMNRFKNAATLDMLLTPNHRVLVSDSEGKHKFLPASELSSMYARKDSSLTRSALRRTGRWVGEDVQAAEFAGYSVSAEHWAAFFGLYMSVGKLRGTDSRCPDSAISLPYDKHGAKTVKNLLAHFPWKHVQTSVGFVVRDLALHSYLSELGKRVPTQVKSSWSTNLLKTMFDWMVAGTERVYRDKEMARELVFPTRELADDIGEVLFKVGYASSVYELDGMFVLRQHVDDRVSLSCSSVESSIEHYEGRVYCVKVPNGTWLMRYNGKTCWTGNSSVIELKNVSHIIKEAYIKEGIVYGTIQVLSTPYGKILQSLIEDGVKVGISSRGVGTTKKAGDHDVVQDDFMLICFDVVSEPSTPGAFITEGAVDRRELAKHFNKSDRIDRVLNEILLAK